MVARKTKTVLVNDTSGTHNPGCQGTVCQLLKLADRAGFEVVSRLNVGYPDSHFADCYPAQLQPTLAQRAIGRLRRTLMAPPVVGPVVRDLCPQKFEHNVQRLADRLTPVWSGFEHVLVNGEGTIHHQMGGAIGLIGLCEAAKRIGKQVTIANCSIFELPEMLLAKLGESVDRISVREPLSFRYLDQYGIESVQTADCLFLISDSSDSSPNYVLESNYVIYTPGVLSSAGKVPEQVVADDIKQLADAGYAVYFWVVEAEDEKLAKIAHQSGARIIPLGSVNSDQVISLLRRAEFVVSGRYHVNIFSAIARAPFVPMETNTSKMSGLMELLGGANIPIRSFNSAASIVHPDIRFLASEAAMESCRALADQSIESSSTTAQAGISSAR